MVIIALLALSLAPAAPRAAAKPSIAGAWTLNKDLSDSGARDRDDDSGADRGDRGGRRGGYGGGGRGGFGGGRYGGGGMGRGGGMRGANMTPEETQRMRDAMRDLTNPSDHLTVAETDSMIVLTGADGRTTRLSPDGKKIKDENTGIERKTKWDGDKLVSEISGLGPGKTTQTFAMDPEHHQLRITVQMEGRGGRAQPRTITSVYDADAR
jgi:Spy/CpxP family protein refolding chaperone